MRKQIATLRLSAASAVACAALLLAVAPAAGAAPGEARITVNPRPAVVGQPVRLTATVTPPAGAQVAPNGFEWGVRLDGGKWQLLTGENQSSARYAFPGAGTGHVRVRVTFTGTAAPVTALARFQVVAAVTPPPSPPPPAPSPSPSPPSPPPSSPPSSSPPAAPPPAGSPTPSAPNLPPIASIRFWPVSSRVGERVDFVSLARDPDGSIVREQWDFDNDGRYDDEGWVASRSFPAGSRTVSLRVTDSRGATAVAFVTVVVQPTRPLVASRLLSPFPVVRIRGLLLRSGVRVTLLQVRAARGVKVTACCSGVSCPYRGARAWAARARELRIRSFERYLGAGTRVELLVTKPGRIGKYTAFTIRRGLPPSRRDLCIRPGAKRPSACPSD